MCHTRMLGNSRLVSKTIEFIVSKDKDKGPDLDLCLNNLLL